MFIGKSLFVYDKIDNSENSTIISSGGYAEVTTDPKGNKTTKIYDKVGRLKVIIAGGKSTTYNYNDNGSKASVVYSDGSSETYTYNKDNTLKSLVNKKADGTVLDSYSYTYDKAKNPLTKVDSKGTTTYTYDGLNRLLTVTEPSGRKTTYTYDKAGNRETETVVFNGVTVVKNYAYNEQNRLDKITAVQGATTLETVTYVYDNNGNQLTETKTGSKTETVTNTYDELNQLVKTVTADGKIVNSKYNGEGLRVSKEIDGVKTQYLYEGDKVVLELDGSGNEKARNVYGTNIIGRTVITKDASGNVKATTAYYMYNGHGDVTKLINDSGEVLASYYYDAFGTPIESKESIDNPYKYSGYQHDAETGTYYLKARMYDPETARFMQEDTYRGDPNDPLSLNLYTYCSNNPLIYHDPSGHENVPIGIDGDGIEIKAYQPIYCSSEEADKHASSPGYVLKVYTNGIFKPAVAITALSFGQTRLAHDIFNDSINDIERMTGKGKIVAQDISDIDTILNMKMRQRLLIPELSTPKKSGSLKTKSISEKNITKNDITKAISKGTSANKNLPALYNPKLAEFQKNPARYFVTKRAAEANNLPVLHSDQIIINNYQRYYSEAWSQTVKKFNQGKVSIPPEMNWKTILGQETDRAARYRLKNFLKSNGIAEGAEADVLVNRWLRDPSGSGKYRIPDLRLKQTGTILDGTIGDKTISTPQIQDFINFSGGDNVIIVKP